jgi:hypothetical protein
VSADAGVAIGSMATAIAADAAITDPVTPTWRDQRRLVPPDVFRLSTRVACAVPRIEPIPAAMAASLLEHRTSADSGRLGATWLV